MAGDKGHVLPNHDLRLFVVQRDKIGHRQDIGFTVRLERMHQCAHPHLAAEKAQTQTIAGRQRHATRSQIGRSLVRQIVAAGGIVAASGEGGGRPPRAIYTTAQYAPLHAELGEFAGIHLDDECLDVDLCPARIELGDDAAHVAVHRFAGGDNEGVGGGVSLDESTCTASLQLVLHGSLGRGDSSCG